MDRRVVVVLPGTRDTSKNIIKYLRDLDVEFKIIPVINVKINYDEVESARRIFSLGFTPEVSVFTSKTAVKIVKKLLPEAWKHAKKHSLAIGPGTASLLRKLGILKVEYPEKHSSEGLIKYLVDLPYSTNLVVYCSSEVSFQFEKFIKDYFKQSYLWKLYSLSEKNTSVKKIVEFIRRDQYKRYIIVVTSLKILKIISRENELFTKHKNVFLSVISKRLISEALHLGLKVDHCPSINNIREYYIELRKYISDLVSGFS